MATLALGYQGGVGAMKRMGGDQLGLDDEGLQDIVNRWRRQNPNICKLWRRMQDAAVHTIRTGRTTMPRVGVTLRKEVAWGFPFPFLTMRLPSGASSSTPTPAPRRMTALLIRSGTRAAGGKPRPTAAS